MSILEPLLILSIEYTGTTQGAPAPDGNGT